MYDSLNLWLSGDSVSNTNLLAEVPCHLQNYSEHYKEEVASVSGSLKNLRIGVFDTGVSIKGSIAKYYLDDNFQTLQRQDMERAIEKLSDDLHIPIDLCKVTRVDLAQNFIVDYPPEAYYNYLGGCQYYNRLTQPKSLYYSNSNRTKLFYNKKAEGKAKGGILPLIWNDKNVLRYEYRLTGRVPQCLKMERVQAMDLYDEQFYMSLIDEYINEYDAITKNTLLNFDTELMTCPKDFMKQLALKKIQELGQNNVMMIIEDLRAKETFKKPEYYSRLKKSVRELCNEPKMTESSELILELNQKIKEVGDNYR